MILGIVWGWVWVPQVTAQTVSCVAVPSNNELPVNIQGYPVTVSITNSGDANLGWATLGMGLGAIEYVSGSGSGGWSATAVSADGIEYAGPDLAPGASVQLGAVLNIGRSEEHTTELKARLQ